MIIDDNIESITCRICGEQCKRIYGKHLKYSHGNMTTDEYRKLYPNAPITAISDKISTSKNSGKHMKDDKYKKIFAEKIRGEKNPNHKSKTSEEVRRSRSPFSKDFIKYDGIQNIDDHISSFVKEAIKDRVSDTTLKYYLDRGYTEEESKSMLSERQKTFTLEKCIQKYGEELGRNRWLGRQEKWQISLVKNENLKCGYSNISQVLFFDILKSYKPTDICDIYFATKNKEYFISKKDVGFFQYDFTDIKNMKIIEFNGDVYHANPKKFKESDYYHPYLKENGLTAKEKWEYDGLKIELAKQKGFDVLVIWESDYKNDSEKILKICLNFLQI